MVKLALILKNCLETHDLFDGKRRVYRHDSFKKCFFFYNKMNHVLLEFVKSLS